ncbi:MAG: hydroxyacid dehydrogenase [Lachnospiraceae bacterium]|nr:hydroxyacid dehydrogenase [Lachnospiraceae bacterium]
MAFKVLIPKDVRAAGKQYLIDHGCEITVGDGSGHIDLDTVGEYDGILVRTGTYITEEVLSAAKKLKVVSAHGVGVENVDLPACKAHGVVVTNAPTANVNAVAEYTILMMLQIAKNTYQVEKKWRCPENDYNTRDTICGVELEGKTLGVVGNGHIGRLVAGKAMRGFGMKIVVYDVIPIPPERREPDITYVDTIDELLAMADFVTLHVPLLESTHHMVNMDFFKKMKKTACILSAARGGVIDEEDLYDALTQGVIAGAALDVFEAEPHVWPNKLFELDNVIVSPHIAGMTKESLDRVATHAAMGIVDVLTGKEPQWPVRM